MENLLQSRFKFKVSPRQSWVAVAPQKNQRAQALECMCAKIRQPFFQHKLFEVTMVGTTAIATLQQKFSQKMLTAFAMAQTSLRIGAAHISRLIAIRDCLKLQEKVAAAQPAKPDPLAMVSPPEQHLTSTPAFLPLQWLS